MSGRRRVSASTTASDARVLEVLGLLWQVEHALRSRSKLMEARLGVTGPQRLVLRLVSRSRDLTPGDLARIVHLHPSTLTGVLQRLVDRGLLERTPDKHDHRRAHLRIRPAAMHIVRTRKDTVESRVAAVLPGLPEMAIAYATSVLAALVEGLAQEAPAPRSGHAVPRSSSRAGLRSRRRRITAARK